MSSDSPPPVSLFFESPFSRTESFTQTSVSPSVNITRILVPFTLPVPPVQLGNQDALDGARGPDATLVGDESGRYHQQRGL